MLRAFTIGDTVPTSNRSTLETFLISEGYSPIRNPTTSGLTVEDRDVWIKDRGSLLTRKVIELLPQSNGTIMVLSD